MPWNRKKIHNPCLGNVMPWKMLDSLAFVVTQFLTIFIIITEKDKKNDNNDEKASEMK